MKKYIVAELEVVYFDAEDIIATSSGIGVEDDDDIIDLPFIPA
jgi:hypothetical protein